MGYDRGDSFPFDFEANENLFGLKSKGQLSPRSYPIQCERKCKHSFLSLTHSCLPLRSTFAVRETASLGQQMLNATVGINGLKGKNNIRTKHQPLWLDELLPVWMSYNSIKRTPIREICVSWHHGGLIKAPLKPLKHHW